MAFPHKKQKLNGLKPLAFELQASPYLSDSNSNTPQSFFKNNSCLSSQFSATNSMTASIEFMNCGFTLDNSQSQPITESSENILQTDTLIMDQNNNLEMRINEWLDNQNILMVRPEDVIYDFYNKMRVSTFKKMEIELSESQINEESLQSSLTDLDYESLDYSHCKPIKKNRRRLILDSLQSRFNSCDMSTNNEQIEFENTLKLTNRLGSVKENTQDSPCMPSLLKRRLSDNRISVSGIETNRFQF